jgi:hypothetical protein
MENEATAMGERAVEIIRVRIEEGESGLLYATSPDLSGFLAAAPDRDTLFKEIPQVIKAMFKVRGMDVEALPVRQRHSESTRELGWAAIPAHIAADALQCI